MQIICVDRMIIQNFASKMRINCFLGVNITSLLVIVERLRKLAAKNSRIKSLAYVKSLA